MKGRRTLAWARQGVDLVIVTTGKRKHLGHEIFKPCRLARKKDRTSSKQIALSDQAGAACSFYTAGS